MHVRESTATIRAKPDPERAAFGILPSPAVLHQRS
jgi:hypothetical protein